MIPPSFVFAPSTLRRPCGVVRDQGFGSPIGITTVVVARHNGFYDGGAPPLDTRAMGRETYQRCISGSADGSIGSLRAGPQARDRSGWFTICRSGNHVDLAVLNKFFDEPLYYDEAGVRCLAERHTCELNRWSLRRIFGRGGLDFSVTGPSGFRIPINAAVTVATAAITAALIA